MLGEDHSSITVRGIEPTESSLDVPLAGARSWLPFGRRMRCRAPADRPHPASGGRRPHGSTLLVALSALFLVSTPAAAQDSLLRFSDTAKDAKIHVASGYVCPRTIGHFERDAVGEYDPETSTDFCAYSARDGVYGTVLLRPLTAAFDAKALLAADIAVVQNTGGRKLKEADEKLAPSKGEPPLEVYRRSYETSSLEDLHYRTELAAAPVGRWAVEVTVEYAAPRDDAIVQGFVNEAYKAAIADIHAVPAPEPALAPQLAQPPGAR